MPRYLSPEWIAALDAALRASDRIRALAPLVVEQVVETVPVEGRVDGGVVRYRIVIDERGGRVDATPDAGVADPGDAPDLRITTDYATAVAIASGDQNAQIALSYGRLRLGGDIDTFTRCADALAALDDVTADVRAATTYEDVASAP